MFNFATSDKTKLTYNNKIKYQFMKKFTTLALSLLAYSATAFSAETTDFTVLTTPEEVLKNSIETTAGAKAEFETVLNNTASTDEEKAAAMQTYMQKADPRPGYGFDMSFLLHYNAITDENANSYSQANLAKYWKTDVEGVTPGSNNVLIQYSNDTDGKYMRIHDTNAFKTCYTQFIVYQDVFCRKAIMWFR